MGSSQIGHRIKLARKREGLSLRALSQKMNGLVSAQALGKYERDEMFPGSRVLIALTKALNVSMSYLLAPGNTRLESVDFRKHSKTSAKEKARVEAAVLQHVERHLQLDEILQISSKDWNQPFEFRAIESPEEAEELADEVREKWDLGLNPIPNVTELLEEAGLKVLLIDLPDKVSGLTCLVKRDRSEDVPVIVANKQHPLERRRLTLVHEFAHRLMAVPGDEKLTEKAATRFAGAFLTNRTHLKSLIGNRSAFSAQELLCLKKVYRVSASALWYRIMQVGCITQSQYAYGCRTFARTWRKTEPDEIEPRRERGTFEKPTMFERKCYWALAEKLITTLKASELLEKPISKIELGLKGHP